MCGDRCFSRMNVVVPGHSGAHSMNRLRVRKRKFVHPLSSHRIDRTLKQRPTNLRKIDNVKLIEMGQAKHCIFPARDEIVAAHVFISIDEKR